VLRTLWARWKEPLILVMPRTGVAWHRAGFRLYWKWLSRARATGGRRPVSLPSLTSRVFNEFRCRTEYLRTTAMVTRNGCFVRM
jgi:hypothetical protein